MPGFLKSQARLDRHSWSQHAWKETDFPPLVRMVRSRASLWGNWCFLHSSELLVRESWLALCLVCWLERCGWKGECGLLQGLPYGPWNSASRFLESPTRSLCSPASLASPSLSLYHLPLSLELGRMARDRAPPFLLLAGWIPPGLSRDKCGVGGVCFQRKGGVTGFLHWKPGQLSQGDEMTQKGLFTSPPSGWILKASVSGPTSHSQFLSSLPLLFSPSDLPLSVSLS